MSKSFRQESLVGTDALGNLISLNIPGSPSTLRIFKKLISQVGNLTVSHNLDSEDLILNLFDANKKVYLPDEYQIIDSNTLVVTIEDTVVGINKIVVLCNAQSGAKNPPSMGALWTIMIHLLAQPLLL